MKHYWAAHGISHFDPGHDCEKLGCRELSAEDVIAMQTIDADCNDCRHFKRGAFHRGHGLDWFEGHCLKFDKPMHAYPVQYSGHPCFEHRKAT